MWRGYQDFKLESSKRRPQLLLVCLSIFSLVASIPAIVMAGFEQLAGGFFLAGLAGSCVQFACSLQTTGRKERILRVFTSSSLLAEILTLLGQHLIALSRDDIRTGALPAATVRRPFPFQFRADCSSQCVWALSQFGIWCRVLLFDFDLIYRCGFRRNSDSDTLNSEPCPVEDDIANIVTPSHDAVPGRRPTSIIELPSMCEIDDDVFNTYVSRSEVYTASRIQRQAAISHRSIK
jgi:hypothetical protein